MTTSEQAVRDATEGWTAGEVLDRLDDDGDPERDWLWADLATVTCLKAALLALEADRLERTRKRLRVNLEQNALTGGASATAAKKAAEEDFKYLDAGAEVDDARFQQRVAEILADACRHRAGMRRAREEG